MSVRWLKAFSAGKFLDPETDSVLMDDEEGNGDVHAEGAEKGDESMQEPIDVDGDDRCRLRAHCARSVCHAHASGARPEVRGVESSHSCVLHKMVDVVLLAACCCTWLGKGNGC